MILVGMDREVAEVRERFAELAARLDPDDLPASHAPALWCELDQLARQVAAAKLLVARRVDDSMAWRREGFASAAEYLAARGGTSLGSARKELDTSKALPDLPATKQALLDGSLSAAQGALIAEAATVNPAAERTLVDAAGRDSFKELKDRSLRAKAAGDADPEATQRRLHRNRSLREYTDSEGAWNLHARGTAADGAKVHAALGAAHRGAVPRRAGRRPPRDSARRGPSTRSSTSLRARSSRQRLVGPRAQPTTDRGEVARRRHQALVRCDLEALQRGAVEGDEVCEVAGVGPIPVEPGRSSCSARPPGSSWSPGASTCSTSPRCPARRRPPWWRRWPGAHPPARSRAAAARSPRSTTGCRTPSPATRRSASSIRLCGHHHELKTYDGWELVAGTGTRRFVPPDHPDHPRWSRRRVEWRSAAGRRLTPAKWLGKRRALRRALCTRHARTRRDPRRVGLGAPVAPNDGGARRQLFHQQERCRSVLCRAAARAP